MPCRTRHRGRHRPWPPSMARWCWAVCAVCAGSRYRSKSIAAASSKQQAASSKQQAASSKQGSTPHHNQSRAAHGAQDLAGSQRDNMDMHINDADAMPVVRDLAHFDQRSGNLLERIVFNHRLLVMLACAIVTLVLGYVGATRLTMSASFEKMMPQSQPYIQNYLASKAALRGLGNAVRVVVENPSGDIF